MPSNPFDLSQFKSAEGLEASRPSQYPLNTKNFGWPLSVKRLPDMPKVTADAESIKKRKNKTPGIK